MKAKILIPLVLAVAAVVACSAAQNSFEIKTQDKPPVRKDKVIKSDAEWKWVLTDAQYRILRNKGTEAAFCGRFYDNHKNGVYVCAGCKLPLFSSKDKFDSGTGWPSFMKAVQADSVWYRRDRSYGMDRIEILCARCDGHLGHVFDDGPKPTGYRFCLNSEALLFVESKK